MHGAEQEVAQRLQGRASERGSEGTPASAASSWHTHRQSGRQCSHAALAWPDGDARVGSSRLLGHVAATPSRLLQWGTRGMHHSTASSWRTH